MALQNPLVFLYRKDEYDCNIKFQTNNENGTVNTIHTNLFRD